MRCMERNKTRFFYALYTTKTPMRDDYGNLTGEYDVQHGKPMEFSANISAAKGETTTRQFGENESYDKVIVMDAHDYIVKKVARSLNGVSVAISKVKVSG